MECNGFYAKCENEKFIKYRKKDLFQIKYDIMYAKDNEHTWEAAL